jgi:hypothetical protein
MVPALKTCHYPNLFSFAPEALRRLAGGETLRYLHMFVWYRIIGE